MLYLTSIMTCIILLSFKCLNTISSSNILIRHILRGYCTRSNRRGVCHSTSINPMNKFITRSNVLGKFLWLNMEEDTNITSAYSYLISSFLQPNFKDNYISRCFSFWFMILVNITNNKELKRYAKTKSKLYAELSDVIKKTIECISFKIY